MPLQENGPAPYAPPQAVLGVIETYRDRGLGVPFTPDVLVRGGVSESLAARTLQSLKLLDLVDDAGNPTEILETIKRARGDDEYRARLGEWVQSVYADILQYTNPAVDSAERVAEAFRGYTPAGQRVRMVSLMLRLFEYAGLPVAAPSSSGDRPARPRSQRPRAPKAASQGTGRSGKTGKAADAGPRVDTDASVAPGIPPGLLGLLREIPPNGKSWPSAKRDTFLQAFTAVLDFSVPVDDSPPPVPEDWQLDEDEGSEDDDA